MTLNGKNIAKLKGERIMKKLSLALAALLVLTMFASCKKTGDDPKTSGSSSSEPTSSSVKDSTEPDNTSAPTQTTEPKDETQPPESSKNDDPALVQNTKTPEQTEYEIPKAAKAPVIDGKFDADEWKGALEVKLDNTNTVDIMTSGLVCQGGTFRYLWDEKGLYVSVEVNDSVICTRKNVAGSGDYNNLDGAQIAVYIDPNCAGAVANQLFFFSFCPEADDGKAYIGEHFVYGDTEHGKDVPDAAIASTKTETGYIIECRIDAAAFAKGNIEMKKGTTLILANIILDNDNNKQGLFVDTAWFNAPNTNNYTLIG